MTRGRARRTFVVTLAALVAVAATFGACGGRQRTADPTSSLSPPRERRQTQEGMASWYGGRFNGRKTASGERFDENKLTAAHLKFPFGTRLRVTNLKNGRTVEVRVNDRGPWGGHGIIDLSKAAARALGMLSAGRAPVRLEVLWIP
jgi:rare lipoprotein A